MIYFSSLHPDRYGIDGQLDQQSVEISALLEAIALKHSRNAAECVQRLETLGIVLGNSGFEAALIQKNPLGSVSGSNAAWYRRVVACGRDAITGTIWYCFSTGGNLYILCCYPRMTESSEEIETEKQRLHACFEKMLKALCDPDVRIILSDIQSGQNAVFRCFNNLHHATEYYDFREKTAGLIQINSEQQLHGAFIEDMSSYRKFSVSMADQLIQNRYTSAELAEQVSTQLIKNSAPSMESVHHHLQIFILTFTEYLGSTGLVDASYMKRKRIVYRVMGFESHREMTLRLSEILEDLSAQYQKLRIIGKRERIQNVRAYVEAHISDSQLTVSDISERFSIGTAQLAKQFSHYYGVSLYKFMQQCRFQLAEQLIREKPTTPIQEIATLAGYADISTMYRAFRQLGNTTPGAVKNLSRGS